MSRIFKYMKQCKKCSLEKTYEDFAKNKSKKDGYASTCKTCTNNIQKKHYKNKSDYYKKHSSDTKQKIRRIVKEIKEASPCQDCGVKYPYYVMDFDHRENKKFIISTAYLRRGINIIFEEIKKCDLVCSNCHRQRTQNRIKLKK